MATIPNELFEIINGLFTTLGICSLIIFIRYIVFETVTHGLQRGRLKAAIAMSAFMLGEVITRGWVWAARTIENGGGDARWLTQLPVGLTPFAGVIIGSIGLLCIIRVFQPDEWGRFAWTGCAMVSAIIVAVVYFTH